MSEIDSKVKAIQTACNEAWKKIAPILYGYVDFDENYPAAIAELKAYKTYNQLSFHTMRVISALRFVESYIVKE